MADQNLSVELFRLETESVRATVTAEIEPDGTLSVEAYDIGKAVEKTFGDSDLERGARVLPEHKDALLLALLHDRFAGNHHAYTDFVEYCDSRDIPFEGWSWT